jgi:hypothetical protein
LAIDRFRKATVLFEGAMNEKETFARETARWRSIGQFHLNTQTHYARLRGILRMPRSERQCDE